MKKPTTRQLAKAAIFGTPLVLLSVWALSLQQQDARGVLITWAGILAILAVNADE
jgi:hypothetical protein